MWGWGAGLGPYLTLPSPTLHTHTHQTHTHAPLLLQYRCYLWIESNFVSSILRRFFPRSFVCRGTHAHWQQGVDGRDATLPVNKPEEEEEEEMMESSNSRRRMVEF